LILHENLKFFFALYGTTIAAIGSKEAKRGLGGQKQNIPYMINMVAQVPHLVTVTEKSEL
jgi:hypothetical protein